jgi:hypothetical protein
MRFSTARSYETSSGTHQSAAHWTGTQIEHLTAGRSSTFCQLAQRYSIQLIREALLYQADTIGSIQGWCLPKESVKLLSS